tara:strand:+ start:99 stop:455 length:357 start_codon:yes stop_codon:yes gene_type:complete
MVRKNYKWNISKEKGGKILRKTIYDILKDNKDDKIDCDELIFALNNRTKDVNIKNNNKKKNLNNFVKNVLGGLIYYIENSDDFEIIKNNDILYIQLSETSTVEYSDWIFIENSDSEED